MEENGTAKLCGYSTDKGFLIFGLEPGCGWEEPTIDDTIIVKYKSYEYGNL